MSIIQIKEPQWVNREWVLDYVIQDEDAGIYTQRIRFEALISLNNYVKMLKERIK